MLRAYAEAEKAFALDEVPVGAVIVCEGRVIARAHNLSERLQDVTAHAEMQAITAAAHHLGSKFLNDCSLYVTLEPCPMCAGASYWARLGRIIYAARDEKRGYRCFNQALLHPSTKVSEGIMAGESQQLLQSFFRKKR